jgi:hypothetical protein
MNVVMLEWKRDVGTWSESELDAILAALNPLLASDNGRRWETGMTENGDAQFYLLGPLPDQVCELCVSRIGRRYILEDGSGRLVLEHQSLSLIAQHAKAAISSRGWSLVARVVLLWCTVRYTVHDKVEPLLIEGEEVLVHLAPNLAAFV